jgi:hypothetical protein
LSPAPPSLWGGDNRPAEASGSKVERHWNRARIELHDDLFGEGFILPGGAKEVINLVTPIGITSAATFLLVGAASGGAARVLAVQMGLWVRGFEAVPDLAELGARRSRAAKLEKRATSEEWNPSEPAFGKQAFHHALALTPLHGASADGVLSAIAKALKSDGHLVMLEVVATLKLDPTDPILQRWKELEQRVGELPTQEEITRELERLGFDVRVSEDVTSRHISMVLAGWRKLVQGLHYRPDPGEAAVMVEEAERWMLRLRLMREGKLRMVRWHGIRWALPNISGAAVAGRSKPT